MDWSVVWTVVGVLVGGLILLCVILAVQTSETIFEYERGLLYYKGKFQRVLEPGFYRFLGIYSHVEKMDVRPITKIVAGQEVLSSDGVAVRLSLGVQYAIVDPARARHDIQDHDTAVYQAIQIALREAISGRSLEDLLASRSGIGQQVLEIAAPESATFGIHLERVDVRDLTLPADLKKAFTQVLKAQKEGQAALERARGETAALRNLANAAKMLEENPNLIQLRMLQALSESPSATVIFGAPSSVTPLPPREKKNAKRNA